MLCAVSIIPRLYSVGFVDPGYGYGDLTELTEIPGTGGEVLHNSQKFQVWVWKSYRTHTSSRYGFWHGCTELTQVSGTGMTVVHNSRKFRVGIRMLYPYPGYCGTGIQNLQKFRVRV